MAFNKINLKNIILIYLACSGFILMTNFLMLGSLSRVYGIAGHAIATSILFSLFILAYCKNKYNLILFLIFYILIALPTYFLSTSVGFAGAEYKEINRAITEGNLASILVALALIVLTASISSLSNSFFLKKTLYALNSVIYLFVFVQCFLVGTYAINYGSGPSGSVITALIQTNIYEAYEFVLSQGTIVTTAFFLLLILIPIFIWFSYSYQSKTTVDIKKHVLVNMFFVFAAIAIILNLNLRMTYNSYVSAALTLVQNQKFKESFAERSKMLEELNLQAANVADGLYVVVIGETLQRDHMSAYGYEKLTTPWLDQQKNQKSFFLFRNPYSCTVSTTQSLSMALTSRRLYDNPIKDMSESPSIIELSNASGFEVSWISNQAQHGFNDLPQTLIANSAKNRFWLNKLDNDYGSRTEFYDEITLPALEEVLKADSKKKIIFIHLMGQHGDFNHRYPSDFKKWHDTDTYEHSDYDNSILYNDHILEQIYAIASKDNSFKAMVYFSDHGEELGVGHTADAFTYNMARIPFWIAVSESYANDNKEKIEAIRNNINKPFTNDLLFDIVCGLTGMTNSPFYKQEFDISSPNFSIKAEDVRVLNLHKIIEDPEYIAPE